MIDTSHLVALMTRLSNEKARAVSELRNVWIMQIEKEIALEEKKLGYDVSDCEMTVDELFEELMG